MTWSQEAKDALTRKPYGPPTLYASGKTKGECEDTARRKFDRLAERLKK